MKLVEWAAESRVNMVSDSLNMFLSLWAIRFNQAVGKYKSNQIAPLSIDTYRGNIKKNEG